MKSMVSILVLLFLTGCDGSPTTEEYNTAKAWCDDFGGVTRVSSSSIGGLRARCADSKLIIDD